MECPIESYQLTSVNPSTSQSNCLIPDNSIDCKTVQLDLSNNGTFDIIFTIKAEGSSING